VVEAVPIPYQVNLFVPRDHDQVLE
jgi:hypothetical protein